MNQIRNSKNNHASAADLAGAKTLLGELFGTGGIQRVLLVNPPDADAELFTRGLQEQLKRKEAAIN